jgi:hypothetical protein
MQRAIPNIRCVAALIALLPASSHTQISLQPSPEGAMAGPPALYGTWGTEPQCRAHRAGVTNDFRLFPYIIDEQWIQHHVIWCRVHWLGHQGDEQHMQAQAWLRCGEDTLREYHVFFKLERGRLAMRWSEDFVTRPLQRC